MRARQAVAALIVAALFGGCGDDDRREVVEATESNTVTIDGLEYRVTMFRQLNPRIAPDQAIYRAELDGAKTAVMAAFLQVCNRAETQQTPTESIRLENAFGKTYDPLDPSESNPLHYEAEPVGADECSPRDASVAGQALPGAAILFEVPIEDLRERPFVLEIEGQTGARRVVLDL